MDVLLVAGLIHSWNRCSYGKKLWAMPKPGDMKAYKGGGMPMDVWR